MTLKTLTSAAIEYRQYRSHDYDSYATFCTNNFGKNSYQTNRVYLEWLYDDHSKSFSVALSENKIVGIEHSFKAPVLINGEYKTATVLHDLMVDEKYRGTIGFRLMEDSLKSDHYLVLPGSVGRLSRVYGRLGSKRFESFWYRKFQFPKNIFRRISLKRFLGYKNMAIKQNILLGHSREIDDIFLTKALKKFDKVDCFTSYFKWRFANKNAPLTFYVTDDQGENSVLFIIGKRGLVPYARIFYVNYESKITLKKIMIFIERITSKLGIPVILYSSFECPPLEGLKYKVYPQLPISFVYSKDKTEEFTPMVPTFCSDIGFDGLNMIQDA